SATSSRSTRSSGSVSRRGRSRRSSCDWVASSDEPLFEGAEREGHSARHQCSSLQPKGRTADPPCLSPPRRPPIRSAIFEPRHHAIAGGVGGFWKLSKLEGVNND